MNFITLKVLSLILLLKPLRINEDIVNEFGVNNVNLIVDDVNKLLDIITLVTGVVERVKNKLITRSTAATLLFNMETDLSKSSFKVVKSVANIIAKVPSVPIMEMIKENELCSRYLDPLLRGLFDDLDNDVFFRWTNERPKELKDENSDLTSERPDAVINSLNGVKWSSSQGFGEAKCSDKSEINYLTSIDLVRLSIFSKSSIDRHSMRGVLTLQAVGTSITFYITIHTHDYLYIMYEIAEIFGFTLC